MALRTPLPHYTDCWRRGLSVTGQKSDSPPSTPTIHSSPGRQQTRLQSGAEKERRKNGEGCAVRELHADQGSVLVMRESEENAQFGVSPASVPAMPLWLVIPGAHGP
ncbi:hypothetical protein T12_10563 [Trichinella patagoniensis]|uniref:Uncharacterized protein n=1 Tax=Trichinella patagoniensis TaxID=990121 RepID=A0A0V0ZTM7_9BILA|nr:hypothetical protein T12_10563 [Trichinella patagoniensis]